jgi:hypothetical protein
MKNILSLAVAALASVAVADVQVFTDNNCSANKRVLGTKAGYCYPINGGKHCILGCSAGHNLGIFRSNHCSGDNEERAPQRCASFGGAHINSLKCI